MPPSPNPNGTESFSLAMQDLYPLLVLVIGMTTIIGMITILRMNAFVSLITAAILVSFLGPGALAEKVNRVATAFGNAAGNIGIVIALAVIIGRCMMESGAADRIVRAFLTFLGQKRVSIALMSSGFVLSIPVFFDTVFYLLVPLARSAYKRTQTHYIRYIIAIAAGGAVTHSLVTPTPGPLLMAQNLNLEIGTLILVGLAVGLPTAIAGLVYAHWIDTRVVLSNPPNDIISGKKDPLDDIPLPNLTVALLPIVLPVIMVSLNTIMGTLAKDALPTSALHRWAPLTAAIGNVNFAMLVAAAAAMITLVIHQKKTREELSQLVEQSLMSGGIIILITAAGGAFGAMLKAAGIGEAINHLVSSEGNSALSGMALLFLGAVIATIMKIAQGSGTVAMITASAMMADIWGAVPNPGIHPVYLATAIGSGSMIGTWMNDSGFWIVAKMGGFTEAETFQTWTSMMLVSGVVGFLCTVALALVLPMA